MSNWVTFEGKEPFTVPMLVVVIGSAVALLVGLAIGKANGERGCEKLKTKCEATARDLQACEAERP